MRPTLEQPLLVGLLVDVSASMGSSIQNRSGQTTTRLEALRDALDDLVSDAAELSRQGEKIAPLVRVFAYGFGFGNVLSMIFGSNDAPVRDLLNMEGKDPQTIGIDELAANWQAYKRHLNGLASEMLGSTPLREALILAQKRILAERNQRTYTGQPALFVVTDGEPDGGCDDILRLAGEMKRDGVLIVSCFVTSDDFTAPKTLYSNAPPDWSSGAKLIFNCASELPDDRGLRAYLKEYGWTVEPGARMFTQINHSETLAEFTRLVLSPLREEPGARFPERQGDPCSVGANDRVRVFVSYSHQDSRFLAKDSLLGYLASLEREGVTFWHDQRLNAGDLWDEAIKAEIDRADIAIVLVSQAFLNSRYCTDQEVTRFLHRRKDSGLRIFPIVLSPCDWKSHPWLAATQFEPRNGKTISRNYRDRGCRDELYLQILQQLRTVVHDIKSSRYTRPPSIR